MSIVSALAWPASLHDDHSGHATTLDATLTTIANRFTCTRAVAGISGSRRHQIITSTVTWVGVDGRTHSIVYQTRYAKMDSAITLCRPLINLSRVAPPVGSGFRAGRSRIYLVEYGRSVLSGFILIACSDRSDDRVAAATMRELRIMEASPAARLETSA